MESPLAKSLALLFYSLRIFSFLQWLKFSFRKNYWSSLKKLSPYSSRPEFHTKFTEIYFLLILSISISIFLLYKYGSIKQNSILDFLVLYFGMESTIWLLYYTNIRRFTEPNFALYHPLELAVIFPVIIGIQSFSLSIYLNISLKGLIKFFVSSTDPVQISQSHDLIISIFRLTDFTVVLGLLFTIFPQMRVLSPRSVLTIGDGFSLNNLFKPSFERTANNFSLIPSNTPGELEPGDCIIEKDTESNILDSIKKQRIPVLIATPPNSHLKYMAYAANLNIPYVVEKPITCFDQHFEFLLKNLSIFDNGFCLGYYSIEKALPIKYIKHPLPIYEQFLEASLLDHRGEKQKDLSFDEIHAIFSELNYVSSIKIFLLEDDCRSIPVNNPSFHWLEDNRLGGIFLDLGIHAFSIFSLLFPDAKLHINQTEAGFYQPRQNYLKTEIPPSAWHFQCIAKPYEISVDVYIGKYSCRWKSDARREALFISPNGTFEADFNKRSFIYKRRNGDLYSLAVNKRLLNYDTQTILLKDFLESGWTSIRYDSLYEQISALKLLFEIRKNIREKALQVEYFTYGKNDSLSKWIRA